MIWKAKRNKKTNQKKWKDFQTPWTIFVLPKGKRQGKIIRRWQSILCSFHASWTLQVSVWVGLVCVRQIASFFSLSMVECCGSRSFKDFPSCASLSWGVGGAGVVCVYGQCVFSVVHLRGLCFLRFYVTFALSVSSPGILCLYVD